MEFVDKKIVGAIVHYYVIMDVIANHNRDLETSEKTIEISTRIDIDIIKF